MGRRKDDSPRKAAMREAVGKFMRENVSSAEKW